MLHHRSCRVRPPQFLAAGLLGAALLLGITSGRVSAATPAPSVFVHAREAPPIYHEGWIDLNKNGVRDPYEDRGLDVEARVADLVARMTVDEKTMQLVTLYGYPRVTKDELPTPAWREALWKDGLGNIDEHMNGNTGPHGELARSRYTMPYSLHARALNEVQRFFVEDTRLGVPIDFTNEGIRGLLHVKATGFPAQIGVASAFDRPLVREIGRVTGREARALGYTNVYSPILDLPRDPRWGRVPETYSEDPYLTASLGAEQVRGIQEQRVVSTLKHFAVYSIPKGGRDGDSRTDPAATWRDVQTMFLAPFRKAVREAGALGVMASYNDYDGVPIEGNRLFLTRILREEWGFKGYVVSDSAAVEFIHRKHRVAGTYAEAVRQSLEAGLNIRTNFTKPEVFIEPLRELVRDGRLSLATLDQRVGEVLRVKYWLGLFDEPYRLDPGAADRVVRAPEHVALSRRAEREALILLKNEGGLLPLRKDLKRVLVAGPLADDAHAWWTRYGPQDLEYVTVLAGIRKKLGAGAEVRYAKGTEVVDDAFPESDVLKEPPSEKVRAGIAEAVAAARGSDVAIAVLGENDALCRESVSRISLNLPGYQEELLEALQATHVPVVLVLSNGRPLSVNWAARHVPAIVETFFPGEDGGNAIADVLFGDYDPAGRLPVTVPRSVGQIPFNFPAKPGSQAGDEGQVRGALFPFGHGLSYTSFSYADLRITPERPGQQSRVQVSLDVTNTGTRAGDEVVQLYLRDDFSSVTTFDKELHGFERIPLAPSETRRVHFTLTPEDLALYDRNDAWTVEPGRFTVMVGASSEDIRLQGAFTVVRADGSAPEEDPLPVPPQRR